MGFDISHNRKENREMKLSGNKWIELLVSKRAKYMVNPIQGEIPFAMLNKPISQSVIALVSTAGVHLKSQEMFDVEAGDPTVRFIPSDCSPEDLMISHNHFDRIDADQDVNCIFPLFRLKELAGSGQIGEAAPTHYGLMGYIPETTRLREETIPAIIKRLKEEKVDAVILNPG